MSRIQYWNYNLIDAPRAWAIPDTGSAAVTVAVIDDGINLHPDISPNLDLAGGYDFVSDDIDEFGPPVPNCAGGPSFTNSDGDGTLGPDADPTMPVSVTFDAQNGCFQVENIANHGLHVSGTIGATNGSANLVTGVNWNVRIRMIRALGIDGFGFDFDIAQAVLYAAGLPAAGAGGHMVIAPTRAPIINMSLGGQSDSTLGAAVAAAINAGSVIIASAGNDASSTPNFPASYPDVISVAALGADGELASYSTSQRIRLARRAGRRFPLRCSRARSREARAVCSRQCGISSTTRCSMRCRARTTRSTRARRWPRRTCRVSRHSCSRRIPD